MMMNKKRKKIRQQVEKDIPQGGKSMARKAGFLLSFVLLMIFGAGQALATSYTITLSPTAVTKLERDGSAIFSVTISPLPSAGDVVTVPYSTSDGSAGQPGDYTATSGSLTFNNGSALTQDVVVSIVDDIAEESSENFYFGIGPVSISPAAGNSVSISGASSATATITDDDYAVSAFSDISVNENAGTATLTVTLDRAVASDDSVSFTYSSADNTAVAGSDYTAVSGTLTITEGNNSGDIIIPITDDSKVECAEDFSVTIVPPSARVTVADPTAVVTINVDDTYKINISSDFSVDVVDGIATVSVIVSPGLASGDSFDVDYATANGSATAGSDYTAQTGTLTFSAGGNNPQTISVPILNDGAQNGSETFTLNLSNIVPTAPACTSAITFTDNSTQITINDHDFKITAGMDQSLDEDGGSIVFTVVLNRDPAGTEEVQVDYTTVDGTATAGNDFTLTSGTLTIDATGTAADKEITVPILDDGIKELAKAFTLKLSQTTGSVNVLITDDTAIGTIYDDDYEVTGFSDITVNENVGNAQLTVTLDRNVAAGDSVSFTYASADNSPVDNRTALAGSDYTTVTGTLNIPVGSNSGTISIPINNDSLIELAENFSVTLTSSSTNVVVSGATTPDDAAIVTIDVDEQYNVSINDVTLQEADAPMTFTVTLSTALQADHNGLVIDLATADGTATAPADYIAVVGGSVSFATGETSKTQVVTIKEDAIDEGVSETYNLNLTGSSIAEIVNFTTSTGVGTILDTDYAITPTWNQDGTVTLDSPIGTSVPITSGTGVAIVNNTQAKFTVTADYRIHSVVIDGVTIPPGTLGYITAVVIDDKNHTYTFESSTPQGGHHTITVLFDHQIAMTATGPGTVNHSSGTGQFIHSGGPELVLADHGSNEDFLIAADGGECVSDLLVDGSSVGAFDGASDNWTANTYTFSNVTDNHTLEAQFGTAEITVLIEADDGASATSDDVKIQTDAIWYAYAADSSYNLGTLIKTGKHGESFSLPADAPAACDTQYIVIQFLAVDNWTKPNDIQIDLNHVFKDQTVEGLYDRDYHILTITGDHGDVTITDTSGNPVGAPYVGTNQYIFAADTDIQLTAVSDPGWFFHIWQIDATGSTSPVTITMDSDKTVNAVFVQSCQDADGDNYTIADLSGSGCTPSTQLDCNDADDGIHPNATDICGDGIDQDCNGSDLACSGNDKDDDGDGYTENQGDCDDTNVNIAPGLYDDPATSADEDCYDGPKEVGLEVTCAKPSDVPIQAARKPAPPLIMFLLDDSGSMDWEFMTDSSNQLFQNRYYIYPVDYRERAYSDSRLTESERRMWLGQYYDHNRIFFNPTTVYSPWPKWEEVIGSSNVRSHEEEYTGTGSFPDTAYAVGFTHADMDRPRLNTYDSSSTINAMYHPGDSSTSHAIYELEMNAEFVNVKLGAGQQIMVTRDTLSSGSSTHADAIGLSENANLELTVGYPSDDYLPTPSHTPPEIIFDNSDGSDIYLEAGTWYDSGGDDEYEWEKNDRYTNTSGSSASWKLNLTAAEGGKDYFAYVWVDEYSSSDGNALYTIFSYDPVTGDLQSETVRRDQSPTNSSGSPATGARWVKLNNTAIRFVAQSATVLSIPNSHYYTWYDANGDGDYWNDTDGDGVKDSNEVEDPGEKYLVIIRGSGYSSGNYSLEYYLFTDVNNNNTVEDGELFLKTGTAIPTAVIPVKYDATETKITDANELAYVVRQDFADWFSFYRRRLLTSKAAVGLTVVDMWELKLGLHTINRSYSQPLVFMDETQSAEKISYLTMLYNIRPVGSTYLRRGLDDVGRYFQENDSTGGYADNSSLKTSDGLNPGTCSGDVSVFYDKDKDSDTDTCDDAGGECQRAYVIAMTDGYYNDGYSSSRIGNADGSSSYLFMRDSASDSLADFAYYYYNNDLDTTLGNNVPPKGFDDASHQKLVTYMVSFGVFGYFDPKLFPDCLPACDTPGRDGCPNLGDITVESWTESGGKAIFTGAPPYTGTCPDWHNSIFQYNPKAIDDLFHASVNGRGKFYNAADPGELVQSLKSIKQLIDNVVGTAASVSVNSRKIENDSLLFQTTYDSSDWSGDVLAKCLDFTGDIASCQRASCEASCSDNFATCVNLCTVGDTACEAVCGTALVNCLTTNNCSSYLTCGEDKKVCDEACAGDTTCLNACTSTETTCSDTPPEVKWSAKDELVSLTYDTRQIITSKLDLTGTAGVAGIPFRWSNLPVSMQTDLNNQVDMLNFLRGSTQYERRNDTGSVHNYRNRPQTVLGDFINSEPYQYANSTLGIDWVFVGGNDGMLHCFDGQTGTELFTYIPNAVFSNLTDLADEGYGDAHKFYVDGYIEIIDLGSKVILVSGLGKGGKGYFALDLTAAASNIGSIEANAASVVLWEYTDLTQALYTNDLGYSFSRPWVGPSNDTGIHSLFVFGNGYDSSNGHAVLFTVGLDSSGSILWTKSIDTGIGDASPNCNGLSSPAILYPQGDGFDDYIYAGDLLGNMWKFDLTNSTSSGWEIYFSDGFNPQPLFTAKSNAGYRQPITMQPDVTTSCAVGAEGYLVAFGTGRMLDPDVDTYDLSVQTAYGVWDWSAAWEAEGVAPEGTYLGSFLPESSPPTAACTSSCTSALGDATTSGTCIYQCLGNSECIEECQQVFSSCTTNCSAVRNLSNMSTMLGAGGSDQYVALLRQTQVWGGGVNYNSDGSINEQQYGATNSANYDEITRVMSQNEIDWLLPSEKATFVANTSKTIKHVGWYFDLPANGERIARDMSILNHKLIYTSSIPSDSPCESGGISNFFVVDICSGGRVQTPFFDINGDGVIDSKDYINIGTEADPVYAAPSSIQVDELAPAPTPVEVDNRPDRLYFPDGGGGGGGGGGTGGTLIKGWGDALQYWRELEWK